MRKWVVIQGKCIVILFIIAILFGIFAFKEYFDAKRVHEHLHRKVDEIEGRLNAIELQ